MSTETTTERTEQSTITALSIALKNEFDRFIQIKPSVNDAFFVILKNKMDGNPLRARVVADIYEYLLEEIPPRGDNFDKFFREEFPFILEVIISIQYYHNQILDGKAGVTTPEAINQNLIIGNLLKDRLYRYLEEVSLPDYYKPDLINCVRAIFEWVDIGQYIEKHHNTYTAWKNKDLAHPWQNEVNHFTDATLLQEVIETIQSLIVIPAGHLPFLRLYLQRIYLTNATLYKLAARFIAEVLQMHDKTKRNIIKFAALLGIATQIVNDNSDLVPSYLMKKGTNGKHLEDAFSDLANSNITLPVFFNLLSSPQRSIKKFLTHQKSKYRSFISKFDEEIFFKEVTSNLSIYFSMSIAKSLKKIALFCLNNVKQTQLAKNLNHIDNNRYYKHFYNQVRFYKTYKDAKQRIEKAVINFAEH